MTNIQQSKAQAVRSYGSDIAPGRASGVNVGETERLASTAGGALLAIYGLTRGSPGGLGLAVLGGALVYRGVTGHCHTYQALGISTATSNNTDATRVVKSLTINRPPEELYSFWHNFENLSRFMKHLESVRSISERQSHWVAKGPAGTTVEWDAEITDDEPNRLIAWKSLPGADVDSAGSVRFEPAANGNGTVVRVTMHYTPPAGALGTAVAKLFGEEPSQQIEGDLRRFRSIMEAGEIPTTEGQPSGKRTMLGAMLKPEHKPEQADAALPDQAAMTSGQVKEVGA